MFRQFATREIVNVAVVVTGFSIVCCILLYTFVKADMMADSVRYEVALADAVLKSMRHEMIVSDRDSIRQMVSDIASQKRVRYARIFNHSGIIAFSSNPVETGTMVDQNSEACRGCHLSEKPATTLNPEEQVSRYTDENGERILSLMSPIYNEPACSSALCHYHPSDQVLLGGMDFGLSQEQLEESLARLRLRMIIFCVMILILTVAGVTALLWRGVMQPLNELVDYANGCYEGKHEDIPPMGAAEINHIGEVLRKLSAEKHGSHAERKRREEQSQDQGEEG